MAESEEDSGENSFLKESFKYLNENKEHLLDNRKLVNTILEENYHRVDRIPPSHVVTPVVSEVFARRLEEAEAQSLTNLLFNVIGYGVQNLPYREYVDDDLADFLLELSIRFEAEVGASRTKVKQGDQFWRAIESDIVVRDPRGVLGLNHRLKIGYDEEIHFSSDLDASISLVNFILEKEIEALNSFGVEAVRRIDRQNIEELNRLATKLAESEEKYRKELRDDHNNEDERGGNKK